jgi:MFS family permease
LIFSLPAGALVDRWDRKYVMILCDIGRMLCMASIPLALFLGIFTIVQLYIVSLIEGTLYVFFNIAEAACLPSVVPKEQLPAATAQNLSILSISTLFGSLLSGMLYALGRLFPFVIDALSYGASAFSLLVIKTRFQQERAPTSHHLSREVKEGLLWLWHQPLIRFMALLTAGLNFIMLGSVLILIVLAQHVHANTFTIGLIFACGGLSSIPGALFAVFVLQKRLSFGAAIVSILWVATALWLLYVWASNIIVLALITVALYFVIPGYDAIQFSYRSALIPDHLQGRVNSVFRLIAFSGQPLGLALTGLLLQSIGAISTVLFFALCLIVLAVITMFNPSIRETYG